MTPCSFAKQKEAGLIDTLYFEVEVSPGPWASYSTYPPCSRAHISAYLVYGVFRVERTPETTSLLTGEVLLRQ